MNTIVKWLAINETFHPEICTSLLVNSSSPYWVIDGNPLINPSEKQRYGASVYSSNDIDGRYQAELVIISVNETLSGSNVSCIVASELRRVYILRTIPSSKHTYMYSNLLVRGNHFSAYTGTPAYITSTLWMEHIKKSTV